METNRLHQFKIIVDAGGLLKASEILGISGGGLSKSIQSLEAELGYELFLQRGRGLELTADGRTLYEQIPLLLRNIESILNLKTAPVLGAQSLRIVTFEVFTTYFLDSLLKDVQPERSVEIREARPGELEELIAENKSDFGITYLPIPHAEIEFQKIGRIKMGIFAKKHKFKDTGIGELPFVVPITPLSGTPSGVHGLDGWPEHLQTRHVVYRVDAMESAIQLCRSRKVAAFLPEFVVTMANLQVKDDFKLVELQFPQNMKPVFRDVFLIKRKGAKETKDIRALAKAIRTLT